MANAKPLSAHWQELAALIKSDKQPNRDYIVIDVRDDDFIGGNIKNAINSPSESFEEQVQELVDQTKQISTVVFHCALSQQRCVYTRVISSASSALTTTSFINRGPKAARVRVASWGCDN